MVPRLQKHPCTSQFDTMERLKGCSVQSAPTSAPSPASLPAKSAPPPAVGTDSPQTPAAAAAPAPAPTSPLPNTTSVEPRGEKTTGTAPSWEGTDTAPAPPGFPPTSGGVPLTVTPGERGADASEASAPPTASQPPAEPPAPTSPPAPASPPASLPPSPPDASSAPVTANHSSPATGTQPTGAPTAPGPPTEEPSSGHSPAAHTAVEPGPQERTPPATASGKAMCEPMDAETTTAFPRAIVQEVEHALSSGSIAAITVTVIAVVLLVFGVAAYLKIRHSSYGRLLDDHDYGSWGNYNNPLYDDS
ncbi:PREDICTED: prostate androgen-regulated mucin-like protein 1 [Propithecus coquereli]|uniref:prostate androgen-regulated mucin-like protein 1 n=1 Tax=Propithecus coquereli TaxID=379532 RepID=UPI00063FA857|nr:PREDICTED: prostate androgen-regulated mucin-like protein 1 [Propithecus coquereli]